MQDNFSNSAPALGQLGALTAALVIGTNLAASYWPRVAGYLLFTAAALSVLELGLWLAEKLCRWFLHRSPQGLLGLGLLVLSIAYTVRRGAGEGLTWRVLLFSGLSAGALGLLAVSWWSLLRWRRLTPWTGAAALLSACAVGTLAVLLLTDGFQDPMVRRYLALSEPQEAAALLEAGPGPFPTASLDYGPEGAVEAGTVDLTDYMSRDTGNLVGHYVDAYWDYELDEVPLRGRVWYPAEGQSCPVLFLAHGNHGITTPSYQGYDYLGAYLASYGYVVISVDQNACNMLTGENDGRAVLLLEHIGLLLDYSSQRENPLYGKIDPDRIAIAGHSRGGEMAATAYLFNGYDCYPENGAIEFDYHYNIRSIIAIAPTVDQYRPADHSVELEDVNYLLLHGSADRDVTSFQGMAQYENVTFTGRGDYLKSALYIAGANHGQFNSLWGAYDQTGSFAPFLNMESLLDQGADPGGIHPPSGPGGPAAHRLSLYQGVPGRDPAGRRHPPGAADRLGQLPLPAAGDGVRPVLGELRLHPRGGLRGGQRSGDRDAGGLLHLGGEHAAMDGGAGGLWGKRHPCRPAALDLAGKVRSGLPGGGLDRQGRQLRHLRPGQRRHQAGRSELGGRRNRPHRRGGAHRLRPRPRLRHHIPHPPRLDGQAGLSVWHPSV